MLESQSDIRDLNTLTVLDLLKLVIVKGGYNVLHNSTLLLISWPPSRMPTSPAFKYTARGILISFWISLPFTGNDGVEEHESQ